MRLYLSSVGVPDPDALFSLTGQKDLTVAVIANAWDVYPADRKDVELNNSRENFTKLAFKIDFVDLRKVQKNDLDTQLKQYKLIWFTGGNSFYLNDVVHRSGLHNLVDRLLDRGIVYGGESAGAVIAGKTLHGVEHLDNPNLASKTIWDGLGLVDFSIVPHWGMEKYAESLQKCKSEMEKYSKVKTLTNEQAFIIDGNNVKLIG